jgi:hypothetical protein
MDIISLTTIPKRIDHIQPCIESLLRQNMVIYLWISNEYQRAKGSINDLPEFLKHDNIRVRRVNDEGSITKLYPALGLWDVDRILTADDDIVYPDDWAKGLLEASDDYPNAAICYRARNFRYDRSGQRMPYRKTRLLKGAFYNKVDIITGVHGALYRREFFGDDFYDYRRYEGVRYVDDIWISGYLADRGVDRICIPRGDIKNAPMDTGRPLYTVDSLTSINWRRGSKVDYNDEIIKKFVWD